MPRIRKVQVYSQHKVFKTNIGKEVVENMSAESLLQVLGNSVPQK